MCARISEWLSAQIYLITAGHSQGRTSAEMSAKIKIKKISLHPMTNMKLGATFYRCQSTLHPLWHDCVVYAQMPFAVCCSTGGQIPVISQAVLNKSVKTVILSAVPRKIYPVLSLHFLRRCLNGELVYTLPELAVPVRPNANTALSYEATEDILVKNKVLTSSFRENLNCCVFWTLGRHHMSGMGSCCGFLRLLFSFTFEHMANCAKCHQSLHGHRGEK